MLLVLLFSFIKTFNSNSNDSHKDLNKRNKHFNTNEMFNTENSNQSNKSKDEVFRIEYNIIKRSFIFDIEGANSCYVKITDILHYQKNNKTDLIEHLVLKNNVTHILPISVYTDKNNTGLNTYLYNDEIKVFTVMFDTVNNDDITIYYEYYAYGIFKNNNTSSHFEYKLLNENWSKIDYQTEVMMNVYLTKEGINKQDKEALIEFDGTKVGEVQKLNFSGLNSSNNNTRNSNYDSVIKFRSLITQNPQSVYFLKVSFPKMFDECGFTIFEIIINNLWVLILLFCIGSSIFYKLIPEQPKKLKFNDI